MLVAEAAVVGLPPDASCPSAASPAPTPGASSPSAKTATGGANQPAGSTTTRGAATAVRMSAPPSTSADTSWTWIWGWMSPPIEPATTHGRRSPSRNSIPGRSVCAVRLPRLEDVRVRRVERERRAAVLEVDAGRGIEDARAEARPRSTG